MGESCPRSNAMKSVHTTEVKILPYRPPARLIRCSLYGANKKSSILPMCGFIAQLVEHRTGIAEVTGSNPVEALIFFRLLLSSCLNWKIHCGDHSSLSRKVQFV